MVCGGPYDLGWTLWFGVCTLYLGNLDPSGLPGPQKYAKSWPLLLCFEVLGRCFTYF